jgi:hypothetical protein
MENMSMVIVSAMRIMQIISTVACPCHGRWFSRGIPASSTTKTGRHDIAEILLKVALNIITLTANHIIILSLLLNNYIMSPFHLESPVRLVKKLTSKIVRKRGRG